MTFNRTTLSVLVATLVSLTLVFAVENDAKQYRELEQALQPRKLMTAFGTKSMLALRVSTPDVTPSSSASEISAALYSDPSYNYKSQMTACSKGQMTIEAGNPAGVSAPGVFDIMIDQNITLLSSDFARSLAMDKAEEEHGLDGLRSGDLYDLVLVCLPFGTTRGGSRGWAAYAYYEPWNDHLSTYNDFSSGSLCTRVNVVSHEIGHNMVLHHSGEGTSEYGDKSGAMGYYTQGASYCFNAPKTFQLGWFPEFEMVYNAPVAALRVVGPAEAASVDPGTEVMFVRIPSGARDYYIGFNRATNENSGTDEGPDQVMITYKDGEVDILARSWLVAKMSQGDFFTLDTTSPLTVMVLEINTGSSPGYAIISILPSTDAPTGVPTTVSPTAFPTLLPTAFPTIAPVLSTAAPSTKNPTATPSDPPTPAPSMGPTLLPTVASSPPPTSTPTVSTTTAPTSSPTAAPTLSPTAAPTSSPTGEPTPSPTESPTLPPVSTGECVTGNQQEVLAWCDGLPSDERCCVFNGVVSSDACSLSGSATICRSSCIGDQSCRQLSDGTSIGLRSCDGEQSCSFLGSSSTSITIHEDSCLDSYSCHSAGWTAASSIEIGPNSCHGDSACHSVGRQSTSITIADGSCHDDRACLNLGKTGADSIDVESDSCISQSVCGGIAGWSDTGAAAVTIESGGCRGIQACWNVASKSPDLSEVTISGCSGSYSCFLVGEQSATTVSISGCTTSDACRQCGVDFNGPVELPNNDCPY